jgi:acyl carrier protein
VLPSESLVRLAAVLGEIAGVDAAGLSADSSSANLPEWDSMTNISFIGAIEEEFDVAIPTADAMKLRSLGEIARYVAARAPAR